MDDSIPQDTPQRQCSKCKEVKPLTEFHRDSQRKSGYRFACRDCLRAYNGYTKREEFPPGMKRCSKCKVILPLDQFFPRGDQPGKPRAYCKACTSKRASEYNADYKYERSKHAKEYYKSLPEEVLEETRARNKKWRLEHPAEFDQYLKKYRGNNRELVNERRRRYYERNAMEERARQSRRRLVESLGDADYALIWERDQGICHLCQQEVDPKDLHFDHVIPVIRGGQHTMENVKVSHAACNKRKGPKTMEEYWRYMQRLHSAENPFADKLSDILAIGD